jgi:hypothetical protein
MSDDMRDDIVSFWSGTVFSSVSAFSWMLELDNFNPEAIAVMWFFKIIGTAIIGLIGGIMGMLGKDIYKGIKRKWDEK